MKTCTIVCLLLVLTMIQCIVAIPNEEGDGHESRSLGETVGHANQNTETADVEMKNSKADKKKGGKKGRGKGKGKPENVDRDREDELNEESFGDSFLQ